jgi:hypothetical protein
MKTTPLLALLLLAALPAARAQTTDGHHSDQLIPVAVDSGSFTQRFNFSTPNGFPVTVHARFFPGTGTAQAATGTVTCNDVVIPAGGAVAVPSLRALCPSLVAGSAFGLLALKSADSSDGMYSDIPVFAAYSRVSNPQGNGFSVEAFASNVFTSATTRIEGLRRRAATVDSPAFQTNCFLGQMPRTAGASVTKRVNYQLKGGQATWAGYVDVGPGQLVRLLDVFAAAGAPAGDQEDATLVIDPSDTGGWQGIVAFCTVQDNTSFGADFRIAKTGYGLYGLASEEGTAAREIARKADPYERPFEIGPGSSANTHVVYFRNPDTVQCRLLDPVSGVPLGPSSGLEMRLYNILSLEAGGNGQTGTGLVQLGDKMQLPVSDNRYYIEVESNETHAMSSRAYRLYCASGSGNTSGYDLVRYQEPIDRF